VAIRLEHSSDERFHHDLTELGNKNKAALPAAFLTTAPGFHISPEGEGGARSGLLGVSLRDSGAVCTSKEERLSHEPTVR
jgi:hypothetical protein